MTSPPGALRVVRLLLGLGFRRWLNRTQAVFRRPKKDAAIRQATPRKGSVGWLWTALVFSILAFQGLSLSYQFLQKMARHAGRIDRDGRLGVTADTIELLRRADRKETLEKDLVEALFREDVPFEARKARAAEIARAFEARGLDGFREIGPAAQKRALGRPWLFDGGILWPEDGAPALVSALGCMLLAMGLCQLFATLGTGNQDLGRVEWSLEWLYGFPAPAGHLFLAKVLEYAFVNAYGWIMTAPVLGVFLWAAGFGAWAVPLTLAGTAVFGLALGSLRLLVETWLRKTFPLNRLKNFQAGFTLLGTLSIMAVFAAAVTPRVPAGVLDFMTGWPEAALWNPFSLPALLCSRPLAAGIALPIAAVLVPWVAVRLAQRFVRDGLLATSGVYAGKRRAAASPPGMLRGVVGKDLRLLLRDRNFLVQTLVVPLAVFGFQLILNPELLRNILSDYRHASVAAYGVGSYVLLCSAFHVLTVEGNTLWLLYTFPHELHAILVRKAVVWCGFGLLYTVPLLAAGLAVAPLPGWEALSVAATAVAGVTIYAFTVAAIGALAADPLQTEVHRRTRTDMAYLAMMLAGLFAWSIYSPSTWQRVVQVLLSTLLALALWQKVRDRVPTLLDPTEEPPPRVALADGLVALLAFFVLQGLGIALFTAAEMTRDAATLAGFVAAGAAVSLFSLYAFWRRKVPRLLHAVGIRSEEGGLPASLGWGLGAGLAGAALARGYLAILDRVEPLRELRDGAAGPGPSGWLAACAVLAAPVFEEFLFRGLVYRGLRRTWSVLPAVLASAFLFAIVHPPVSAVPVFALGVLAALAFERGKRLLAPVLAHAVYNAAVLL